MEIMFTGRTSGLRQLSLWQWIIGNQIDVFVFPEIRTNMSINSYLSFSLVSQDIERGSSCPLSITLKPQH